MSKIVIDARMWGIKNTGIGRYIENLIDNLPKDVILIVSPEAENEPKLAKFKKYVARYHPYTNLAQFEMWKILRQIKPDLLHVPHFTVPVLWPGKMVITIHDLIKHLSRGAETTTHGPLIYWLKYFQYLIIVWWAVRRADHIIVPSKFWKRMLISNYHVPKSKVSVTYEGVSGVFLKNQISNIKYQNYLLYVGNIYPHKNIPVLLEAVKKMPGQKLIIACARNVFAHRLHKLVDKMELQNQVEFSHLLDDEKLSQLYRGAFAFVTPSLIEGFGLPGLEAMACGTPVISANASCLPEIYDTAALYFDPHNANNLVEKINSIKDKKLRVKMIDLGRKRVKLFSWKKMSEQTWQIYQDVLR